MDLLEFKDKTESLRNKSETILRNYKRKGFENVKCYGEIEKFVEHLDDCIKTINYYNKPTIEGTLHKNKNGRFDLVFANHQFTSGSSIEVLVDGEWCVGRVEYGSVEYTHGENEGYYFYNYDGNNIMLENGMTARIRN